MLTKKVTKVLFREKKLWILHDKQMIFLDKSRHKLYIVDFYYIMIMINKMIIFIKN